jgi:hypothetical protein
MNSAIALLLAIICLATAPAKNTARTLGDLGKVGTVSFPTSCDPRCRRSSSAASHCSTPSTTPRRARYSNRSPARDPDCAMAQWGIAMTYYHPIWSPPDSNDLAAGMAAVRKALAAGKQDAREKEFVHAIEAYYEGVDSPNRRGNARGTVLSRRAPADYKGRAACFRREMETVAKDHPNDVEAASFYALSLLATAPPGDASLSNQKKAASILETWYAKCRTIPGSLTT